MARTDPGVEGGVMNRMHVVLRLLSSGGVVLLTTEWDELKALWRR
jgi:hypothetical protein